MVTIATQTIPPELRSTNTQTTETKPKPTYTSIAIQADADAGKMDKGKGKAGQPAPTAATSASVAEDIVMKDWSPYENLSDYEKEAEVSAPQGAPTWKRKPVAPPAATIQTGTIGAQAIMVHGISCQRPMAEIIQDARRWGIGDVLGACWLLGFFFFFFFFLIQYSRAG